MHRLLFAFAFAVWGCGGVVSAEPQDLAPGTPDNLVDSSDNPSCAAVEATCTDGAARFVRGHASNLSALDGARVVLGVRYILSAGSGLDVPHGVVVARSHIADGAFEACVCVPRNADMYPEIAAVVYRPDSTRSVSAEVTRATFAKRYAVSRDEDLSLDLKEAPTPLAKEAALAAMSDRVLSMSLQDIAPVRGVDRIAVDGTWLVAGIIADERPVAAQLAGATIKNAHAALTWVMPGHAWPSERVAFVIDLDRNGQCDGADVGGFASAATGERVGEWLQGSELTKVCAALEMGKSRE